MNERAKEVADNILSEYKACMGIPSISASIYNKLASIPEFQPAAVDQMFGADAGRESAD